METKTQEQTDVEQGKREPQLIILKGGKFYPAQLVDSYEENNYIGFDVNRNSRIMEESIDPKTLELIASIYMGPLRFKDEATGYRIVSKEAFNWHASIINHWLHNITERAITLAKNSGADYYMLFNNIARPCDLEPIEIGYSLLEKRLKEDRIFGSKKMYNKDKFYSNLDEPKEIEFTVHPTLNLYVPKE